MKRYSQRSGHTAMAELNVTPLLDLAYEEDSRAEVDMNVAMTSTGGLIELQGTAEREPFGRERLGALLDLAELGIRRLFADQQAAIDAGAPLA